MKPILFLLVLIVSFACPAQVVKDTLVIEDGWQKVDAVKKNDSLKNVLDPGSEMKIIGNDKAQTVKKKKIYIYTEEQSTSDQNFSEDSNPEIEILGKNHYKRSFGSHHGYRNFDGHWCGFYFGFVNFANADYSLYPDRNDEFMDLDYGKSFVMQFNVFQQSINLVPRNNFGLVVGLGLEYQRLRFSDKNRSVKLDDHNRIIPWELNPDWNVKRNSFKVLYLTVPLLMEVQFPAKYRKSMYVSAGIMGGIRLHSKTKVVYNNVNGNKKKDKVSDDFSMIPVKADVVARIGYHNLNVWASYTLTEMFKSGKGPELHPYSIGFGVSF